MKKHLLIAAATMGMLSLTSCEDFLDSTNYTEANTGNYPAAAADLNKELSALYGVMNQYCNDPLQTPWLVWDIMSDDANGGGGTGELVLCTLFFPDQLAVAFPIALAIGNLVDPPATMVNAAGDYVASFIVERFVNGKDWLQKKLAKDSEKKIGA